MAAEGGDRSPRAVIRISTSGPVKPAASMIQAIQVTKQLTGTEFLKLPSTASESEFVETICEEPLNSRRHELLARRPSFRKLFNDLTGDQQSYISKIEDESSDGHLTQDSNDTSDSAGAIGLNGQTFHLVSQDENAQNDLPTLTVGKVSSVPTSGATILQYTQGSNGKYFIPMHQLPSGIVSLPPSSIMVAAAGDGMVGLSSPQQLMEEASRKRELRLLKNKEAAKECRRKKKEYVKCLENRVAVLENQNKTLIEELKSLKELYCQKEIHS